VQPDASVFEAVARYFFFSSLDENLSYSASLKVLAELNSHNYLDAEHRPYWIRALHRWKGKLKHVKARAWPGASREARGFALPAGLDIAVWASFLAAADAGESEAVLLSRVLGFSDEEIAFGLDVTEGTVRYRVGRGLRHLGGFIES
jgi:hypothetical protein